MTTIRLDNDTYEAIVRGSNEAAWEIYLLLHDALGRRGLFDVLRRRGRPLSAAEVTADLDLDPRVAHRVAVALDGLSRIGCLERAGEAYVLASAARPERPVDHAAIDFAFSPMFRLQYMEIYRREIVLDPGFALTFGENEAEMWEGLLNSPANALWRDLARDWVARGGGRVVDLAFGTPVTLIELSERVGTDGRVYGVEASPYFVDRARRETEGRRNIAGLFQRDINESLGELPDVVDGVMFAGALHFVRDVGRLVRDIDRITTFGARVALIMFFSPHDSFAGPAFDMHRNLFTPVPTAYDSAEVERLMASSGFECRLRAHLGSYCSLYFEKYPMRVAAPAVAAAH